MRHHSDKLSFEIRYLLEHTGLFLGLLSKSALCLQEVLSGFFERYLRADISIEPEVAIEFVFNLDRDVVPLQHAPINETNPFAEHWDSVCNPVRDGHVEQFRLGN